MHFVSSMSIVDHLARLQARIETVAGNNSRRGKARLGLDNTLAALDRMGQRRVTMMLEMIRAFSDDLEDEGSRRAPLGPGCTGVVWPYGQHFERGRDPHYATAALTQCQGNRHRRATHHVAGSWAATPQQVPP
jgi:hypothetical protein